MYLRDKDDWTADAAPRCIVGQSIYELLGIQLTGMNNAVRTILVVCGLGTVSEAGMDWINQLQKVFDATLEGDAERRTWSAALETAQEQYWYNRSDQDFLPI